ncbi:MAG: HEAT repeat domain-containing protein, partial [Segetibacter sp.]
MKKLLLLLACNLLLISTFQVNAQKDNRTNSTRIADVLAQLPAKNEANLKTAMKEMEGLGEVGLMQLPQQMVPGGNADNSKLEYAIMGYTAYVSGKGREALKRSAESAWCKSASMLKDKKHVSFLLSMLEIIGTDQSIDCITPYLNDGALSLKATATLASIGTAKAGETLTSALSSSSAPKYAVLQALGEMRFAGSLKAIAGFISSNDIKTKEAALYALAQIANPSSAEILLNETRTAGTLYGNKDATARYASYIGNLNTNGQSKVAGDLATAFYNTSATSNVFTKTAALGSVVKLEKGQAIKLLVKA